VPEKLKDVQAPTDAPQLEARALSPVLNESFKAPPRPFTAPPSKPAQPGAKQVALEAPPEPIANSKDLSVVVAGLNPSMLPSALPSSSSPGQFSAGPKPRPDGADAAGDGKGFTVPDLYVEGAKDGNNTKADLLAQAFASPTAPNSLRAAALLGTPRAPIPHEDRPATPSAAAVKVSGAPDKRFNGRDIYMMAIQMPNLTSYSGSWLMWYADRTARDVGLAPVAPPVPLRKVDPKYVASAQSDRIEGKIQLACVIGKDGRVSHVEMVHGLDDRLNATAQEAMAKWEFEPATRHGEPVEVDVLVEIPFRLEPFHPKSY
jgi:TonB family protein